jgi:hypothetical protein
MTNQPSDDNDNILGMVKTKTYAPPKGGVGTNNVELSKESDADLLGQHDTTEDEIT